MSKKQIQIFFGVMLAITVFTIWQADFLQYYGSVVQAWVTLILVLLTAVYTYRTKQQADASAGIAKETREQRIMSSRPIIIQKAVVETETEFRTFGSKDWFSFFEIYNAGNGPAIEVQISLLNNDKSLRLSHRESFLRAGETPIEFSPSDLASLEKSTYYLVSEYKSVFPSASQTTWYQTWLPFKTVEASKKDKIYVMPGELEFKEVTENECINAFSGGKPK